MTNNNIQNTQGEDSRSMTRLVFSIVGIWFLLAVIGGMLGMFYQSTPAKPPLSVGMFVLVPIIGFVIAYAVSTRMRRTVNQIPLWLITIAHVWRFVGIGFVVGAILKIVPPQFGYPEGLGDILTALFCIPLALEIRKKSFSPRLKTAFIAWNIFGLADLIAAISLGILYSPSSFGVLRTGLSTAAMTAFPVNLIPTFFVPLFILFHLLALSRRAEISVEDNYTSTWQNDGEIKFIKLKNGISLRYFEVGKGRPLILLHTLRTQLDYFQGLVPLLKDHFHIYAIDLPGHGRSSLVQGAVYDEPFFRQSIADFIKELDLKNVILAGESIGAVLALAVTSEMPDRIEHVYALNPYDYGEKFGGGIRRSKYGYIIGLFWIFRSYTLEIRSILKLILSSGFVNADKLPSHLLSEFNRTGERPGYRNMEYLLFRDWRSWLDAVKLYEHISVPVTLAYGECDWSMPEEREDRKNRFAGAKMFIIPDAGHFSSLEQPMQVARILIEGSKL